MNDSPNQPAETPTRAPLAQDPHFTPTASRWQRTWPILAVAAIAFLAHFGSLFDGLFFDDYWHRATLREYGWSFDDLVESATFDLPGRLAHLWWQEVPLQWRYARPFAMLAMKVELILSGGSPLGVHLCAVFWHILTCIFVYFIALRVLHHRGWAFLAGCLFAFQPHSVFAVSWIAARNALVSGCFLAAAMLAYVHTTTGPREDAHTKRPALLALALVLWLLALFSRETAIVLPVLALTFDWCQGGLRFTIRRIWIYVLIGVLALAYLYWRLIIFPTSSPPDIYYTSASGPAYALWAASKMLHMVFALFFLTPLFLGLVTFDAAGASHLIAHGIMLICIVALAVLYFRTSRGEPTRWLWPIWIVAAFLPVVPVFVMPHFGYLPAIASVIALTIILRNLRGWSRRILTAFVIASSLWTFAIYRYVWRGIVRGEQVIYAAIEHETARPEPGSKLFFINLPVAGIYGTAAMREAWNLDDLEGYVLTFAPHPLMMNTPATCTALNDHELVISTDSPGYFSGLSGSMLRAGMRPDSPLEAGTIVPGELFDATILEGDAHGITSIKFAFHRPLDDPAFYFYACTAEDPAQRLVYNRQKSQIEPANPTDTNPPWAAALGERDIYFRIIEFTGRFIQSDLTLTGNEE